MPDTPTRTAAQVKPDPVLHVGALVFVSCCRICHELVVGQPTKCPRCEQTEGFWIRGTAEVTDVH